MDDKNIMFMLGEIKADLEHNNKQTSEMRQKIDSIDERMAKLHINANVSGGLAGTVAGMATSIGVALISMKLKTG